MPDAPCRSGGWRPCLVELEGTAAPSSPPWVRANPPLGLVVEGWSRCPAPACTVVPSAGLVVNGDRSAEPPTGLPARDREGPGRPDLPRPPDRRAVLRPPRGPRRSPPFLPWPHLLAAVRVIATAGHVDHGKSSLVLALTGTDPDRFEEEKRRGLTIDLGFAHTELPSGETASSTSRPRSFLRNMLAGVGGGRLLFVVAATEGWKPQSEEHLRILELLGVGHGVVALSKVDAVDDDLRELAQLDVTEHVAGTFLAGA